MALPNTPLYTEEMARPKSKAKARGAADGGQKVKLIAAVGCLVVAAVLMLWNFGVISFGGDPLKNAPVLDPGDQKAMNDEAAKAKERNDAVPPARRQTAGAD